MAPPPPSPPSSPNATPVATPSAVPPPVPVETHPNRAKPLIRSETDPSRLAPEDAYKTFSPPRLRPLTTLDGSAAASAAAAALRPAVASLRQPPAIPPVAARLEQERKARAASRKRREPHVWKKLLWIKQRGFPDNYTDADTFLDHLQRNPKLQPYDFWPLVADSTVIVQHVCSVALFVSAYAGIYQDRLSPVAVVAWGTLATLVGWFMWDFWKSEEEAESESAVGKTPILPVNKSTTSLNGSAVPSITNGYAHGGASKRGLGLSLSTSNLASKNQENGSVSRHGQSASKSSFQSISPIDSLNEHPNDRFPELRKTSSRKSPFIPLSPTTLPATISHRNQARLKTFKSALLIYFAVLGLSPILKSLTKSTSSDSIWALATWLLIINIFFFDYGSQYTPSNFDIPLPSTPGTRARTMSTVGRRRTTITVEPALARSGSTVLQPDVTSFPGVRAPPFPSSLSTNAAVMASTVLASRLSTTTAVFSLSLFSIQVFGLFPVFRRHLRHRSLFLHVLLTLALVTMASAGLGLILSRSYTHTYGDCGYCFSWIVHVVARGMLGVVVGTTGTAFVMGGCSWWLISLQRYKNVVIGPWDPARPVLAGGVGVGGRGRTGTD